MLKNDISEQPSDLSNLSFTTGTFTTLLKKYSILDFTIYCLISLSSNLGMILEKLILSRLSTFSNIKDMIYSLQFGFRQNYPTSYALIHITETIKEAQDQSKYGCGICVDFQKGFDTVGC